MNIYKAEYIWLEELGSSNGRAVVKSTTKIFYLEKDIKSLKINDFKPISIESFSHYSNSSYDMILIPCKLYPDPQRADGLLILCESFNKDMNPTPFNNRRDLDIILSSEENLFSPIFNFTQEYSIDTSKNRDYDPPKESQRDFAEDHLNLMISAGINPSGINKEDNLGWSYGLFGGDGVLSLSDDLIISRYFLDRLSEKYRYSIVYDSPKINYFYKLKVIISNDKTRNDIELSNIRRVIKELTLNSSLDDIKDNYGYSRLSEYPSILLKNIDSLKIPLEVRLSQKGYIEDTRPLAHANPYKVLNFLIKSLKDIKDYNF